LFTYLCAGCRPTYESIVNRAVTLLFALLPLGQARADIFTFVDPAGVAHFSNVPVDPRYEFLLASPKEKTRSGDAYDPALLAMAARYDAVIARAATESAVEPELLRAVIAIESGFNARAVSRAGAAGLMQLMPSTAKRYGVHDRFDPAQNVRAGASHLKSLIRRYGDDLRLALAAYNAGETAVDRCGRCIPQYRETQDYVPRVLRVYERLRGAIAAT
jgi:soluble lytic murein transglycosylase-like protein